MVHNIILNAKELKEYFNTQTAIGLCLHFWRHFLGVYESAAGQKCRDKVIICRCLSHIVSNLQYMGQIAKDPVTDIIHIELKQVSVVTRKSYQGVKTIVVGICDLASKKIGNISPVVMIDFLIDFTRECVEMLKFNANNSVIESSLADCYLSAIEELIPELKPIVIELTPLKLLRKGEQFYYGGITVNIVRTPIETLPEISNAKTHLYAIGAEESLIVSTLEEGQ